MSACKYCDAPIGWSKTSAGWRPMESDGSPHRCKKASPAVVGPGVRVAGAAYTPSCGECSVPPWENCACSFPKSCAASAP